MSDEISRRPQSVYLGRGRGSSRPKSPWIVRFLAQMSVAAIFLAAGYYGADLCLKFLDRKSVVKQENVVSNAEDLQKLLAADQSDEFVASRRELAVYPLGTEGLVRASLKVLSDVQEDEIMLAVRTVFTEASESWANQITPKHVYRDGVTAYIDLPGSFTEGLAKMPEQRSLLMLTGLVRTIVENFPPVKQVYFLVNGRWVTNVGKIRLSEPWGFSGA
ncbi:MAG: GerMN domain-containing protein [Pyramidobacter sp.]|nr:GerMN domain-containing protein [Pyramidobacter sp.]